MPRPHPVRRAAWRVVAGGLTCAIVIGAAGVVHERMRFGTTMDAARTRVEADVRAQFQDLARRLEIAVDRLAPEPAVSRGISTRDPLATRELFAAAETAAAAAALPGIAITVYGPEAVPIAWVGGPAVIPLDRLSGPEALFLALSPLGLRLVRVEPVGDSSADRRVATLVAEAPLPTVASQPPGSGGFRLATAIVPVPLRPRFEGAGDVPGAIVVRSAGGEALASIDVPAAAVDEARRRWRAQVLAAELTVACGMLLLFSGPLLDWRRVTRRVNRHVVLTLAILTLLVTARLTAWIAVRLAGLDTPALASRDVAGIFWPLLASPIDFLLTALLCGAMVGLASASFEQWRRSRRLRVRVVPAGGVMRAAAFLLTQLAAGALVALLIAGYQAFLRTRLTHAPVDILQFGLHPWDWPRLAVVIGVVMLHAALLALAVLFLRLALWPWVVAGNARWIRGWIPVLWAVPSLAVFATADEPFRLPSLPAALAVAVAIVAAWRLRRYRATLEHGSQAVRLFGFFIALAVPSLVFYPSLVDAASRARRQLVETRYAPEVVDQRLNLQRQLDRAREQIDAFQGLADLVNAGEPVLTGLPSTDAAFLVWSRTVLADLRLTSSVELYDRAGSLVSRFALKLPEAAGAQPWQDNKCEWEVFGEASPFFSEERILLHASRGICTRAADGREVMAGSVVVHVTLDRSNLSFISAQSPYVALLRGDESTSSEPAPREDVEFTVYGWSRRPLYRSGRDAWQLSDEIFNRIYRSRDPFWAEVARGDETYDVYLLNDRAGIYALGYRRTSAIGHSISLAELVALAFVTYVLLLLAGFVYGLIAARTPASGRELLREVRASFYRKLFIAFVAAAVIPVLALALVTRAYIAGLLQADVEMEATRTAGSASRVVEDVGTLEARGSTGQPIVDDNLVVWLSRVIAQDVNIFDGAGLLASSERNLFASGLLPTRTPGDVYRAILLEGRPSYVGREIVAGYEYLLAAAPVRVQNRYAILTVPLTLRQREIEAQRDELDRRVLLAAVLFIMLGAAIGYSMAERIADPVNRLMKATRRIARGELDARILPTYSDEFRRLVEAFNQMAADLQRQRAELERTNRLAAWADMARQVAHDIKNPLTPIQLNAEHLRRVHADRGEPLGSVLDECVHNILTQVRLLRQIASEFSSFASSPTAKPAPASLPVLVSEVVEPYRVGLAGRVAIETDVPETLPRLMVDKALLARALTNIIENALHAMPGGGRLRVEAVPGDGDGQRVQLSISDTGIGMDEEALGRMFEPYFSTRATGTGLGLTIAKRNVELNNGTIEVRSQRGVGTTVILTLPAVSEE